MEEVGLGPMWGRRGPVERIGLRPFIMLKVLTRRRRTRDMLEVQGVHGRNRGAVLGADGDTQLGEQSVPLDGQKKTKKASAKVGKGPTANKTTEKEPSMGPTKNNHHGSSKEDGKGASRISRGENGGRPSRIPLNPRDINVKVSRVKEPTLKEGVVDIRMGTGDPVPPDLGVCNSRPPDVATREEASSGGQGMGLNVGDTPWGAFADEAHGPCVLEVCFLTFICFYD